MPTKAVKRDPIWVVLPPFSVTLPNMLTVRRSIFPLAQASSFTVFLVLPLVLLLPALFIFIWVICFPPAVCFPLESAFPLKFFSISHFNYLYR